MYGCIVGKTKFFEQKTKLFEQLVLVPLNLAQLRNADVQCFIGGGSREFCV